MVCPELKLVNEMSVPVPSSVSTPLGWTMGGTGIPETGFPVNAY